MRLPQPNMPSRRRRQRVYGWPIAAVAFLVMVARPAQATDPAPGNRALPAMASASAVAAAAAELRQDKQLFRSEKQRDLRWRDPSKERPQADEPNGLLKWIVEAMRWLSESGRALLWVAGAVLLAVLVVKLRLWRWLARGPAAAEADVPPTHVRDLDIRPASLPADIGAAAWQRWQAADSHGALVLLYRGMLSRLVHGHGVPLRASSTEGECLGLSRGRVGSATWAWLAGLVALWRGWVYGSQRPADADVQRLCSEFAAMLPAPAAAEPTP